MNHLWDTVDARCNIVKVLNGRHVKPEVSRNLRRHFQFTAPLVKRLGLETQLEGHDGCVNCLEWSSDGRLLASGSDDTNIILWKPFQHKKVAVIPTRHIGNIFSVKFIGDGSIIVTGAGDSRVIVQSINYDSAQPPILECGCHANRVKRIAIAPDQPQLFWTAGEDGLVLQFDMREPHECTTKCKVFVDLSYTNEFKCIAVNPTKPHLIAVGANDCYVRLYDRRMVKLSKYRHTHTFDIRKRVPPDAQNPNCVQYFSPGHLAKDSGGDMHYKISVTYISFDPSGNEMLVNTGGDHIYTYDLNNPRYVNQVRGVFVQRQSKQMSYKPCCLRGDSTNPSSSAPNGFHMKSVSKHNYKINLVESNCLCGYMERASRLLHRKWTGDLYAAARDYLTVIENWPEYEKAYLGLVECLVGMKWKQEAMKWADYTKRNVPNYNSAALSKLIDRLGSDMATEEPEETLEHFEVSDIEKDLRLNSRDFDTRFIGHCNTTTDIKEANYLGEDFICAGSDDGMIFIWDRKTTNLLMALLGDFSIVNCVQPHPSACLLASSGIDPVVKLWSPKSENDTNANALEDPWSAIEPNQRRMVMDPFETMLANIGYHLRDASPSEPNNIPQLPTCRTS